MAQTTQWKPPDFATPATGEEWKPPDFVTPTEETKPEEPKSLFSKGLDWLFTTPKPVKKGYAKVREKYEPYAQKQGEAYAKQAMDVSTLSPFAEPPPGKGLIDVAESMSTPGDIAMMAGTGGAGNIAKATRGLSKIAAGALAARGAIKSAKAEDYSDLGAGLLELGMGALGFKFPVTWGNEAKKAAGVAVEQVAKKSKVEIPPQLIEGLKAKKEIPAAPTAETPIAKAEEVATKLPSIKEEPKPDFLVQAERAFAGLPPEAPIAEAIPEFGTTRRVATPAKVAPESIVPEQALPEQVIFEAVEAPQLTPEIQQYVEARNTGKISEKTSFDQFRSKPGAAPERRVKIHRGMNGSVDIIFEHPDDKQLFSAIGRSRKAMRGEKRLDPGWEGLAKRYNLSRTEVFDLAREYREQVMKMTKGVEEGSSVEVPRPKGFESNLAKRFISEESGAFTPDKITSTLKEKLNDRKIKSIRDDVINSLVSGGRLDLNAIAEKAKAKGVNIKQFNKIVDGILSGGEIDKAVKIMKQNNFDTLPPANKVIEALRAAKPLREEQEAIYSEGRSERIKEFMKVKTRGEKGAKESLSKLKGEFDKVYTSPLEVKGRDKTLLFDAIKQSPRITPFEKARAFEAMFKLLDGGHVPQRGEIILLDRVFGGGFGEELLQLEGGLMGARINISKAANTMKAAMASMDMSAPLRQGLPLIHRKEFWSSFMSMFKYAASDRLFKEGMNALEARPRFALGRDAGLHLSDTGNLLSGEEHYLRSYISDAIDASDKLATKDGVTGGIGKLASLATSPFKMSERAYVGFLNKLRADVFDAMIDTAVGLGHSPDKVAPAIARFVNTTTGRGTLPGRLNRIPTEMNAIFFSPKLIASRIEMLTSPSLYRDLPKGMRKEGIKSLLSIAVGGTITANLAANAFGGTVESDPTSADFGKMRFGEQTLDPYGGFQQYAVAAIRFVASLYGYNYSNAKGIMSPTPYKVARDFTINKLAPATKLATEIAMSRVDAKGVRKDRFGKEMDIPRDLKNSFVPIFVQDVQELIESDADVQKILGIATPTFFGMGSMTYPAKKDKPKSKLGIPQRPRIRL